MSYYELIIKLIRDTESIEVLPQVRHAAREALAALLPQLTVTQLAAVLHALLRLHTHGRGHSAAWLAGFEARCRCCSRRAISGTGWSVLRGFACNAAWSTRVASGWIARWSGGAWRSTGMTGPTRSNSCY